MNFSKAVRRRMKELGINTSKLARRVGYSPQYIHDLLAEERRWNEPLMRKVCKELGLRIELVLDDQTATLDTTGTEGR